MKKKLEIEDMLYCCYISSLRASPDKTKSVFAAHRADIESNGYHSDLYLYDTADDSIKQITYDGKQKSAEWLDNDILLFASAQGKKSESSEARPVTRFFTLSVNADRPPQHFMDIPADVTWIRPLSQERFAVLAPSYLPDTDAPAAKRAERDTWFCPEEDYIVADELPFRQDGMGITNGKRSRCFVYDRITDKLTPITDEYQNIESIAVDKGRIILSARHFRKHEPYLFYGDVEVYDDTARELHILMDENKFRVYDVGFIAEKPYFAGTQGLLHGYQNENPSFYYFDGSGKPVCFCHNDKSHSNTVGTDSRLGSTTGYLTFDGGVFYIGTEEGCAYLKMASTDGCIRRISKEIGSVDDFALMNDCILYCGMHENRPEELYILKEGTVRRITDFNRVIACERSLSVPEPITFTSAGQEMDGYVIKPIDFDADKRYPGILYIHGGHKCVFGRVYFHEMQVWANRGFFVFYCNPRGSDSRDDDFADIIGHYGFYEEEDLLAFQNACLKRFPQIDETRLGVCGGSYGGYLTNWMIGRTYCYKCAVSQRGIASWLTMFFSSDTNYLFPCYDLKTDVWNDAERYWRHSPLKYADKCCTPTLFIHSECDYRCPVSEGISMFNALQFNGVESRLCIFKGESHGLIRGGKPRSRVKRLSEITNWFEKHLLSNE